MNSRSAATPPTLEDVARAAGLSRATVSRVVNGGALVSPRSREAVDRAIAQLGYSPNLAARMLVTKRSGVVGVLVPETDERVFTDPFFAGAVRGATDAFPGEDTQVILAMSKTGEAPERLLDFLVSGRVDAAVIVSHHGTGLARAASKLTQPVVFVGAPTVPGLLYVDIDQHAAAGRATRYLVERGCTRIATITGPLDMPVGVARRQGFLDAMSQAGLRPVAKPEGDFTVESGAAAAERLLARHPRIDGIFAASDAMAAGAIRTILAAGRQVPEDVAVVGFDDALIATQTRPTITTMTNPAQQMARQAATMVRQLLEGGPRPEPVLLVSDLVIRQSA